MSENKPTPYVPNKTGLFQDLAQRIKLILRLMGDNRVSPILKLIPLGAVVYLVFPDLAPGPIDDAAVIWLGTYLFVELCPPHVVEEHMNALKHGSSIQAGFSDLADGDQDDVVEGEYKEH